MKRQIFEVDKRIIGMTGNNYYVPVPSGYPKVFDSHAAAYNDDIDAALLAATGAFAAAWSEICTTKNCDMQVVILSTADGFVIDKKVVGAIPDLPDAEPEE
jgi:hypothetical protein